MAQVNIAINGQSYTVTCDDGQETRLQELAAYFDSHVSRLTGQVGNISDSRLMLLAGLTICDELKETETRLQQTTEQTGMTSEEGATRVIEAATKKVNDITVRLADVGANA